MMVAKHVSRQRKVLRITTLPKYANGKYKSFMLSI